MIDRIPDIVLTSDDPMPIPTSMLTSDAAVALLLDKLNEVIDRLNAIERRLEDDWK